MGGEGVWLRPHGKTRKLGGAGEPDERWSMTDRIANPWGDRTPFGPGGEWQLLNVG